MEARDPLVVINDHGDRPPLFCIHPVGGHLNTYLGLRELLGRDQPIYGLRSRAQIAPELEHRSISDMAASYATVIEGVHAHDAYRLFGWSMGALTAHAVACELERRGARVELVAMVDPRLGLSQPTGNDLHVAISMAIQILHPSPPAGSMIRAKLRLFEPRDAEAGIAPWCVAHELLPESGVSIQEFESAIALYAIHRELVSSHEPAICSARMVVWKARDLGSGHDRDWSRHTTGSCTVKTLGADHFSVMRSPHLEAIASDFSALA